MYGIGTTELIIILILVMVVFGAGKLPQVGKQLGSAINEFKSSVKPKEEEKSEDQEDKEADA